MRIYRKFERTLSFFLWFYSFFFTIIIRKIKNVMQKKTISQNGFKGFSMIWISHIRYWKYNWPQRIIKDIFGSCSPPEEQSRSVASLSRDLAEQSVHIRGRQREHTVSVHREHPLLCISDQMEHFHSKRTKWANMQKKQHKKQARVKVCSLYLLDPLRFKFQICHLEKTKISHMNKNNCVKINKNGNVSY